MGRRQQGPRLYLDPTRKRWVVRYQDKFQRTPYPEHQRIEAEKYLRKILVHPSWMRALRISKPTLRMGPRLGRVGTIYFVSKNGCDVYPVKIGFCAADFERRLIDIQTGNPEPLKLAASQLATFGTERKLHEHLAEYRISGEWFARSEAVCGAMRAAESGSIDQWIDERSRFIRCHNSAIDSDRAGGGIDISN